MQPIRIAICALTFTAATALHVSGVSASSNVTHTQYLRKANAVCARLSTARKAAAKQWFPQGVDKPPTIEQLQGFYAAFGPTFTKYVEELAAVTPARTDRAKVDKFMIGAHAAAAQIVKAGHDKALAQHLLDTDEAELHTDDQAMAKFGYKC